MRYGPYGGYSVPERLARLESGLSDLREWINRELCSIICLIEELDDSLELLRIESIDAETR